MVIAGPKGTRIKELTRNNTRTLENKKQGKEDIPFPAFHRKFCVYGKIIGK